MKANEAPEQDYMTPSFGEPDNVLLASFSKSHLNYHRDIEYTRTDAFIEKVENYLNSKLYDWVSITNPDQRSYANVIPKKDFIEDFKNYMKGE